MCEWKMDFDNIIIFVKSERRYNIHSFWDIRRYLLTKIDYFERQGYNFSHTCELKITFMLYLRKLTNKHYFIQPKKMIERKLNEKIFRNPELIKTLRNISHLLIRK